MGENNVDKILIRKQYEAFLKGRGSKKEIEFVCQEPKREEKK